MLKAVLIIAAVVTSIFTPGPLCSLSSSFQLYRSSWYNFVWSTLRTYFSQWWLSSLKNLNSVIISSPSMMMESWVKICLLENIYGASRQNNFEAFSLTTEEDGDLF